ncbi:GntR family transcriptional regulator [Paenibacillus lentus]|uniref:GntR family transcriptional regulator n=1 Tax=Paenibacillus lentus TaxID=1338368 RepID=UPI00365BA135
MAKKSLYLKVRDDLAEKIKNKTYRKGEFIPSENELEEEYKVSRTTIRTAIRQLVDEGYLTIVRGKGTRVSSSKLDSAVPNIMSFTDIIKRKGLESSIIEMSVKKMQPTVEIASKLEISTDEEVIEFYRVRSVDDEPITIHCSYVPVRFVGSYDLSIWEKKQSFYKVLKEDHGITIQTALDNITAIAADAEMAKILHIEEGEPVLHVDRIAYDQNNAVVEFTKVYYRGDRYKHTVITRETT